MSEVAEVKRGDQNLETQNGIIKSVVCCNIKIVVVRILHWPSVKHRKPSSQSAAQTFEVSLATQDVAANDHICMSTL